MADNYFGITDVGRMRTNNEDTFIAQKVLDGRYIAACVIDGVGGYEGGEVAAAITRQAILDYFSVASGDMLTMMKEAFAVANEKIAAEKKKNKEWESMACVATLAMVDVAAKTFYYAHIGDTRLYLLRDNSLVKISKDQSFVGYLEDSGRISESEAMQHPKRNEINNAIGFDTSLNTADIETGTSPFLPGDVLLLCSDGLSDLLNSHEITSVLLDDDTLHVKATKLVMQANEKGGKDNITVVLVRNHRKPVVQKATKPTTGNATVEKKTEASIQKNIQATAPTVPRRKKKNSVTLVLILLCLVLGASVAVLLLQRSGVKAVPSLSAIEGNSETTAFQSSLDSNRSNNLLITDSIVALPIVLNDTVWIRRDSLHVQGNGMRLLKSTDYDGPAIAIDRSCKYVLLENVVFQNFDIAILTQNRNLRLKNVRFVGCRVPVQAQSLFTDTLPVSGTVHHFFTPDTVSH